MKRFIGFITLLLVIFITVSLTFADCATLFSSQYHRVIRCTVDWTSAADGTASGTVVTGAVGRIIQLETVPGVGGDKTTGLPTALYDVTVTKTYGFDIASGALADRSGTVAEVLVPNVPIYVTGTLSYAITNAGNAKSGRLIVTLEE